LPGGIYARSYIRQYPAAVGQNPDPLLSVYIGKQAKRTSLVQTGPTCAIGSDPTPWLCSVGPEDSALLKRMTMKIVSILALLSLGAATPASLSAHDHGHKYHHRGDDRDDDWHSGGHRSNSREFVMLDRYYAPLRRYARTGQLPPSWQMRIQPFPVALERELPPPVTAAAGESSETLV
jgi:Ni/Co efflux regulator RcnB